MIARRILAYVLAGLVGSMLTLPTAWGQPSGTFVFPQPVIFNGGTAGNVGTFSVQANGPTTLGGTTTIPAGATLTINGAMNGTNAPLTAAATGVTFTGTNTYSGNNTFSGNNTLSGATTFSSATTYTGNALFKSGDPWYDVRAFGATGNGTTNDTAAIQAAITAANTAGGGIVWFPPGIYLIATGPITLSDHVSLLGPLQHRGEWWSNTGKGAVLRDNTSGTTITGSAGTEASLASSVEGLSFESTSTTGQFIHLPSLTNDLLIQNNSFQGKAQAIYVDGYDLAILDNFFQGQANEGLDIAADGGNSLRVSGNYFRAIGTVPILLDAAGIGTPAGWLGVWITHNEFAGNFNASTATIDFSSELNQNLTINQNYIEGFGGFGIVAAIQSGSISDNHIVTSTAATVKGIDLFGASANVRLHGNAVLGESGATANYGIAIETTVVGPVDATGNTLTVATPWLDPTSTALKVVQSQIFTPAAWGALTAGATGSQSFTIPALPSVNASATCTPQGAPLSSGNWNTFVTSTTLITFAITAVVAQTPVVKPMTCTEWGY